MSRSEIFVAKVIEFLDSGGSTVGTAEALSPVVLRALKGGEQVVLEMADMPPVSSSFFNLVLRDAAEACGVESLERIDITGVSQPIRDVFSRSRAAVSKLVGEQANA
jgi:hypothetical protein